ncbi:hypothetical protein Q3G72_001331 [Acer saccharum]|nr:hypothetical protein Q3G72_001331 [Acer saccharum]
MTPPSLPLSSSLLSLSTSSVAFFVVVVIVLLGLTGSIRRSIRPFASLSQSESSPSPPPRTTSNYNESITVSSKAPSSKPPFVEPSKQHDSGFNYVLSNPSGDSFVRFIRSTETNIDRSLRLSAERQQYHKTHRFDRLHTLLWVIESLSQPCLFRSMEKTHHKRSNRTGIEENILAILESTEAKDTRDTNDDRIAFIEAVRAASFIPENGTAPTYKMHKAVFNILRVGKSLELIMSSYQLLIELNKRFPRVHVSKSSSTDSHELIIFNEDWLPFVLSSETVCSERQAAGGNSIGPLDYSGFTLLIQELDEVVKRTNLQAIDTKYLRNMLLLQYLVNVLEGDLLPRKIVYEETSNWNLLRESLLNMLLGSRRINYKVLMKDCLSILSGLCQVLAGINNHHECSENSVTKPPEDCDPALAFALLDEEKSTCVAIQKLLTMIMELDKSKKNADMLGHTTRADGVRTPLMEIIVDELNYERDIVSPFLQVFSEPKWKLEIIVHYFSKYITKASQSVGTKAFDYIVQDDATFDGILKYFSNSINLKNFLKKISTEIVQLLLAHAFQAYLSISSQYIEGDVDSKENVGNSSLVQICKDVICTFKSLSAIDENIEILPIAKEALFAAATILAMSNS